MSQPSDQQQAEWGKALADGCREFPRIAACLSTGITVDPIALIGQLSTPSPVRESLQAAFHTIEAYLNHQEFERQQKADEFSKMAAALAKAVTDGSSAREKPGRRLTTDPEPFSGEEKDIAKRQVNYVNWRSHIGRVLQTDSHIFKTEFDKLQYTAGRLTGEAYRLLQARFDVLTANKDNRKLWPWESTNGLVATLDGIYATMDLSKIAALDYDDLWMKGQPYPQFIAKFVSLATQCHKTDAQKVEDLKKKVSRELAEQLRAQVDVPGTEEFSKWCGLFQKLWDRQQEAAHYDKLRPGPRNSQPAQPRQTAQFRPDREPVNTQHADGDPMQLDAIRRPFVSKERCQANGLCFYCKRPGHGIGECEEKRRADARFGPPIRPSAPLPRGYQQTPRPQHPRPQFHRNNGNLSPHDVRVHNWQNGQARSQPGDRSQYIRTAGYATSEVDSSTPDSSISTLITPTSEAAGGEHFFPGEQGNE